MPVCTGATSKRSGSVSLSNFPQTISRASRAKNSEGQFWIFGKRVYLQPR